MTCRPSLKAAKSKKPAPVFGWVGVINMNELDLQPYLSGSGVLIYGVVYKTRKAALQCYQSVRRVVVKTY